MLIAGCTSGGTSSERSGANERPNVLFLVVDDQNDWVGVTSGHPQATTPNIDRLARRGVLFANAHTAAPACNPSRTAVVTGIRPSTSGMYLNPQQWRSVLPDAVIIPEQFRRHGYKAMGGGKILHGNQLDPDSWDEYFPSKERAKPGDPLPETRPLNGIPRTGNFDWGALDVAEELYDHSDDPHEWYNLADEPEHAETKERLARRLPAVNMPGTDGSQ